ncbi:MAG TPA: 2-C-methyl-D-erythritol 2,4-cyclodiphosphate synthase [Terriglobales bacterium]|nr:2-C-methyl-D-erythritol 2,4-cyclodiphosphate synthase [Terriglobales bacterium]
MRIGYGFDSHEFKRGVALKIGGVHIRHSRGLAGHSDGDVLLHALTDALLGAVAAGDIGRHFPPSDPKWKNADSALFVAEALKHVRRAGYSVANVDSTLILAEPRIGPHAGKIQERVAELLGIAADAVGLKAKTPEGLGTPNTAIAHVVVLLQGKPERAQGRHAEAEAETPTEVVDEVVRKMLRDVEPEPHTSRPGRRKH